MSKQGMIWCCDETDRGDEARAVLAGNREERWVDDSDEVVYRWWIKEDERGTEMDKLRWKRNRRGLVAAEVGTWGWWRWSGLHMKMKMAAVNVEEYGGGKEVKRKRQRW